MTLNDLEPLKLAILLTFVIYGCDANFKSELRWNGLKYSQDNTKYNIRNMNI